MLIVLKSLNKDCSCVGLGWDLLIIPYNGPLNLQTFFFHFYCWKSWHISLWVVTALASSSSNDGLITNRQSGGSSSFSLLESLCLSANFRVPSEKEEPLTAGHYITNFKFSSNETHCFTHRAVIYTPLEQLAVSVFGLSRNNCFPK